MTQMQPGGNAARNVTVPVSVVILTMNEERDLPGCIASAMAFSDDVFVLDSGSTDRTVQIAAEKGVAVYQHAFNGFGDQRNWAIDHLPHRHDWVLHLDADERATDRFVAEIGKLVEGQPTQAGFYVPSKMMLGDKWLKFSGGYPVYQVRLFHRQRLRFVNHGHGQREVTDGEIGTMREPYLHYAFSKGLRAWFEKHARYAEQEALLAAADRGRLYNDLASLFNPANGRTERRRAMKRISYRLPCRSWLRFIHFLIIQRGLRDGGAGITYARLMAAYESMFVAYCSAIKSGVRPAEETCEAEEPAANCGGP